MSDQQNTARTLSQFARSRGFLIGIAGALVLAIGGLTLGAVADAGHRGHDGKFGWLSERKIERLLDQVDASDDQRERVLAIVNDAAADLQEDRGLRGETWQGLVAALTGDTIDRAALEMLRQQKLETVDHMSQRMLTALADVAEVLTPAQRAELADKWGPDKWKHPHD